MASRLKPTQPRRPKRAADSGVEVLLLRHNKAATPSVPGCNPMYPRLQPYVSQVLLLRDNKVELAAALARRQATADHKDLVRVRVI